MKPLLPILAAAFAAAALTQAPDALARTGSCEIEVVNSSQHGILVHGTFDDGSPLHPFTVYAHDAPHYINLHYHGYCHSGMHVRVESFAPPVTLYNAWTHAGATVRVVAH